MGLVFIHVPGDMLADSILGFSVSFVDVYAGAIAS